MLGARFTDKVLPIVAGWVSGSVVTWMVVDNDRRNKNTALNKPPPSQLCEKTGVGIAAPQADGHTVPSCA